jgi:hypothetical protein
MALTNGIPDEENQLTGYKVRNSCHSVMSDDSTASLKNDSPYIFASCVHEFSPRFSQSRAVQKNICGQLGAMNFCPFPHSLRDQVWLAVGVGAPARRRGWAGRQRPRGKLAGSTKKDGASPLNISKHAGIAVVDGS